MIKPPVDIIPQAKMMETDHGLLPEGPGWYILNAKDATWHKNEKFGESVSFEGSERFDQFGINIHVIYPGQPNCHYHGEDNQEDFLVLKGTCSMIIEGIEVALKEWDFVHCPKWTKHVFVGTGDGPCAILMVGGRLSKDVFYPIDPLANKYKACPSEETDSPPESYKDCPKSTMGRVDWPL